MLRDIKKRERERNRPCLLSLLVILVKTSGGLSLSLPSSSADMTLGALLGTAAAMTDAKEDLFSSEMVERPKGEEEEVEEATLGFLACLVAAVFLAAATPRTRAVFSFSLAEEGWGDFLTMPPEWTVPLQDLWAVAVDAADEGDEMGGMVIFGF
jgi:hypothetical protein